jgi:hypothetical protein
MLTPAELASAGFRQQGAITQQDEVNFLLEVALDRLAPLAQYHVIGQWQKTQESANSAWWNLRLVKFV